MGAVQTIQEISIVLVQMDFYKEKEMNNVRHVKEKDSNLVLSSKVVRILMNVKTLIVEKEYVRTILEANRLVFVIKDLLIL